MRCARTQRFSVSNVLRLSLITIAFLLLPNVLGLTAEECLSLDQYDTYGDGWNGWEFSLYAANHPTTAIQTVTLEEGSYGQECLNVQPGSCYTFSASNEGTWASELSWSLCGNLGGSHSTMSFCFDQNRGCVDVDGVETETCLGLELYDSWGDGWNQYEFSLFSTDDLSSPLGPVTLDQGSMGQACIAAETDQCYQFKVSNYGYFAYELSWKLCNITGDATSMLSFCFESDGTCRNAVEQPGSYISVLTPTGGSEYVRGEAVTVSWDFNNLITSELHIYLVKSTAVIQAMPSSDTVLASDQTYDFVLAPNLGGGVDYWFVITDLEEINSDFGNAPHGDSDFITINLPDDCSMVLSQFDSYGDGWEGNYFSLYQVQSEGDMMVDTFDIESTPVQTVTLIAGILGTECLDVEPNSCYFFELDPASSRDYLNEISWLLCGYSGEGESVLLLCTDDTGGECIYAEDSAISVTAPAPGSEFPAGGELSVVWNSFGLSSEYVAVYLYQGTGEDGVVQLLTSGTMASTGMFTGDLDADLEPAQNYWVVVVDIGDSEVYGFSNYFTVTEYEGDMSVEGSTMQVESSHSTADLVIAVLATLLCVVVLGGIWMGRHKLCCKCKRPSSNSHVASSTPYLEPQPFQFPQAQPQQQPPQQATADLDEMYRQQKLAIAHPVIQSQLFSIQQPEAQSQQQQRPGVEETKLV